MPLSLHDPSSDSLREVGADTEPPTLALGPTRGGPTALTELRQAVTQDVLARQLPFRAYQRNGALAQSLAQLAQGELGGACEAETLRYWILTAHYRAPLTLELLHDADGVPFYPELDESERGVSYLYAARRRLLELPRERVLDVQTAPAATLAELSDNVSASLEEDLNTPLALVEAQEFALAVNALCDAALRKKGHVNVSAVESAEAGFATLKGLLGLCDEAPVAFLQRVRDRRARRKKLDVAAIERKVAQRTRARAERDFETSDRLQAELLLLGVSVLDGPQGTSWTLSG